MCLTIEHKSSTVIACVAGAVSICRAEFLPAKRAMLDGRATGLTECMLAESVSGRRSAWLTWSRVGLWRLHRVTVEFAARNSDRLFKIVVATQFFALNLDRIQQL